MIGRWLRRRPRMLPGKPEPWTEADTRTLAAELRDLEERLLGDLESRVQSDDRVTGGLRERP